MKYLSMQSKADVTNAGIRYQGDWEEICDFADYLSDIIDDHIDDDEALSDYNHWKPEEDGSEKDLSKRTAEDASMEKTDIEKNFNGAKEELNGARDNLLDSIEHATNGDDPRGKIKRACKKIGRTMGAKSIESVREMEKQIYDKIMLKLNPFYFDDESFSINLEKNNGSDLYTLTLNIPNEKIREDVKKRIKEDF